MPTYYETTAAGISTSATAEGWIPASGFYPVSGYYYDMPTSGYYCDPGVRLPTTSYYYGYQYIDNTDQTIGYVKPEPAPMPEQKPEPEPCTEEELLEFLKS